jgi:hypothetical protein
VYVAVCMCTSLFVRDCVRMCVTVGEEDWYSGA